MTMDYATYREALAHARSDLDASECHGVLCGLLCAAERFSEARWIEEVFASSDVAGPAAEDCASTLRAARQETQRQLDGKGYEFAPLLPDDDAPLPERGEALAHWCHGFLYGLALGGLEEPVSSSEEVREVLGDLSEFSRLDVTGTEAETNAMEADYAEIVEYVRVGVMLVHMELRARFEQPSAEDRLH
jgi:yecA family protein